VPTIACKECGFSIQTSGKGRPDYRVKASNDEFVKRCKTYESMGATDKTAVPIAQHMTNCPHLSRSVTAALLPSAL
jgi:hypothetical protein